jgi:hypothetical protein
VKQITSITGLPERIIAQSIPAGRRPEYAQPAATASAPPPLSVHAKALGCLLCEPSLWLALSDAERETLDPAHFADPAHSTVSEAIFELGASGRPCDISAVTTLLDDPAATAAASDLYMRTSHATTIAESAERNREEVRMLFRDCMKLLAGPAEVVPLDRLRQSLTASGGNRRALPRPTG